MQVSLYKSLFDTEVQHYLEHGRHGAGGLHRGDVVVATNIAGTELTTQNNQYLYYCISFNSTDFLLNIKNVVFATSFCIF